MEGKNLMSRSRALNRSNRAIAKRRRRTLRSVVPSLQNEMSNQPKPIDHSQDMQKKALAKETLLELIDPQTIDE